LDLVEQLALKQAEEGIEQVGKHNTDQHGTKQKHQSVEPGIEMTEIGDEQDQQNDRNVCGYTDQKPLFVFGFHGLSDSPFRGVVNPLPEG
jgi:hypothetical protein